MNKVAPMLLAAALLSTVSPPPTTAKSTAASAQQGCVTCLGKLTSTTIQYQPLGTFKRTGSIPRRHGKPLLFLVGALYDGQTAVERWGIVKALSQFGTFSRVGTSTSNQHIKGQQPVTVPTFYLLHARFTSRYVEFDHKDLQDRNNKNLQNVTQSEISLLKGYSYIPVLLVGGYSLSRPMVGIEEFVDPQKRAFSFEDVRAALEKGGKRLDTLGTLVYDINIEANIISALICHANGAKPSSVCGQKTIRYLMKHAR